jgi:hypothetical protein
MASHRPYERLLHQAQRLTQRDEDWAGTTRLARMWVTPKKAPPYRPYLTLWLSQDGKIVASKAHQHPPSADELVAELLQTMRRPALGAGRARRPSRLYLDSIGIPIVRLASRPGDTRARWGREGTWCGPLMGWIRWAECGRIVLSQTTQHSEVMRPHDDSHATGLERLQTDLCRALGRL